MVYARCWLVHVLDSFGNELDGWSSIGSVTVDGLYLVLVELVEAENDRSWQLDCLFAAE